MQSSPNWSRIIRHIIAPLSFCLIQIPPAFGITSLISFDLNAQPMAEVASQISKQLNYKILMDEELATVEVSGVFNNVTLDDFFSRRIFRGANIVILFDDNNKLITISSIGKGNQMNQYNQTTDNDYTFPVTDPLDMEIQPGIMRRDVVFHKNNVDPMDMEIQPGIMRRDVILSDNNTDPLDMEIQPGIRHRDVVMCKTNGSPGSQEIQPGIKRQDALFPTLDTLPLDMEVQPGIRLRDTIGLMH